MGEKGQSKRTNRVLWLTGIAVALAVHAIGLLLFQLGEGESPEVQADRPFVSLPSFAEAQGELLRERAYLFDSEPLFFPTRWNASSSPQVQALDQRPAELFDSYPARLSFGESDFGLGTIISAKPESPLKSLQAFEDSSHTVFGQADLMLPPLSSRFALLEVRDPAGGKVVLEMAVPDEGAPAEGKQLWAPAEFLLQIEATGVVGHPVLLRGSGVEEVDQFLRRSLRRITSGQMLDVGYYRVLAGP